MTKTTTQKNKAQARKEAERYNANLTHHLHQRMIYNPGNTQYKADYDNRRSQFKKVEW